jgi:hypothetical protein
LYAMSSKSNKSQTIIWIVFYSVIVIISLIAGWNFLGSKSPDPETGFIPPPNPSLGLILGYVLLGLSVLVLITTSIYQLIDNPRKTLPSLIGFGVIVVLFLILYAVSSGQETYGKVTETYSKLVGSTLNLGYIFMGGSVVILILAELYSIFK